MSERPPGPRLPGTWATLREGGLQTLVGFAFADALPIGGALGLVDWHLAGLLASALRGGSWRGRPAERLLLPAPPAMAAKALLVVGLGATLTCEHTTLQRALTAATEALVRLGGGRLGVLLPAVAAAEPRSWQEHAGVCAAFVERQVRAAGGPWSPATLFGPPPAAPWCQAA